MADKITVAEAVALANQNTKDLTNEQLAQMSEAFAESFLNREPRSAEVQMASDVTIAEIDARLETLAEKQDLYNDEDLDSIIAMAESVGIFSQKADIAQTVLKRAQTQKAAMEVAAQSIEIVEDTENQAQNTAQAEPQTTENQDTTSSDTTATENKEDEDTLTKEDQQAIEVVENTPEDQAELDKFDKEIGIDKVTQEQLEKNDKIMDNMPHPLAHDENGNLVNKEFAEEIKALNNLIITDDVDKELSAEEQEAARLSIIEAAQLEAETYARAAGNGNEADVQKLYNEYFKEALQRNVVSAVFASGAKKSMTKEQLQAKFAEAVNNPQKASRSSVVAVSANGYARSEKIVDRIKAKFKSIPAVQKMENKAKAFDKRMTERYGMKWQIAKRISKAALKSISNVAIYSAIGAMSGPAAPAAFLALAGKSAYDSVRNLQKEANNQTPKMTLKQYVMANKGKAFLAATTPLLSLAGSAIGVGNSLGVTGNNSQMVQTALKWSARGLAFAKNATPALVDTVKAGWKKFVKKDNEGAKADWGKAKEGWTRTLEATVGLVAGTMATEGIAEAKAATAEVDGVSGESPHVEAPMSNAEQMTPEEMTQTLARMGLSPEMIEHMPPEAMQQYIDSHPQDFHAAQEAVHSSDETKDVSQMTPEEMTQTLAHMGLSPEMIEHMPPEAMQQYINLHPQDFHAAQEAMQSEHHEGVIAEQSQDWTKANETQLNRLMDVDPAKVNALLNDGEWHSSSELKAMMENGQFNEEQLKAIHGLASKEFDANGHIKDADLKEFYEERAREAAAREAAAREDSAQENANKDGQENSSQEHNEEQKGSSEDVVLTEGRTEAQQHAYEAIKEILSKGADMNNPEVRASIEGAAASYVDQIQTLIDKGDNVSAANIVAALHNQGENYEIAEATRANEEDSRKLAHAKEDVLEAKAKLDAAKEAYLQDPNNEKLREEIAKLEQKFDRESIDLQQREIKEMDSQAKEQIKHDEKAYDNRDKSYQTIAETTGLTEKQVNEGLASMGIDVNNLPQDRTTLPQQAQELLLAHDMYDKAHQNDAALQARIQTNEQLRENIKEAENALKQEDRSVKHGEGLSVAAQEYLPGQSQVENSKISHAYMEMMARRGR